MCLAKNTADLRMAEAAAAFCDVCVGRIHTTEGARREELRGSLMEVALGWMGPAVGQLKRITDH